MNKSGWNSLAFFIPFLGYILVICLGFAKGNPYPNDYGPPPGIDACRYFLPTFRSNALSSAGAFDAFPRRGLGLCPDFALRCSGVGVRPLRRFGGGVLTTATSTPSGMGGRPGTGPVGVIFTSHREGWAVGSCRPRLTQPGIHFWAGRSSGNIRPFRVGRVDLGDFPRRLIVQGSMSSRNRL